MLKCLNPWDPQSKRQYQIDGVYCALNAGNGICGQAHGICYAIEGNIVDRVSAKNRKGWCEDVSPTLNTQDRHAVAYAMEDNGARPSHKHSVCYSVDCRNLYVNQEISGTLQAKTKVDTV